MSLNSTAKATQSPIRLWVALFFGDRPMRPHWVEDRSDSPPHIIWRLIDGNGLEMASLFVEKIGDDFLLDRVDIEQRKRELEQENL